MVRTLSQRNDRGKCAPPLRHASQEWDTYPPQRRNWVHTPLWPPTVNCQPSTPFLPELNRTLGDRGKLLAQREHLVLPVARFGEPRESGWKCWIAPAPREPC